MEGDVDPKEITSTPKLCTEHCCIKDKNENVLECYVCKRKVHWKCTALPLYQLQRYIKYNCFNYMCATCIEVPEDLQKSYGKEKDISLQAHEKDLKEEITILIRTIQNKDSQLEDMRLRIKQLEETNNTRSEKTQKRRRINDDEEDTSKFNGDRQMTLEQDIVNKDEEILELKKQNESLKEQISERTQTSDEPLKDITNSEKLTFKPHEGDTIITYLEKAIDNRINSMQNNLVNLIEEKLNTNCTEKSYASTTKGITNNETTTITNPNKAVVPNFRSIMMSTRNEELAEQRDKKARESNIIIHGKEEIKEQDDSNFAQSLIQAIGVNTPIKLVSRIGRQDNSKKRPIKIVFNSSEDREKVMENLKNLKGKDQYKGISITEDYTISERQMIREFTSLAKEKNVNEPENSDFIWKVRGTPKNGLVLKRFMKVKNQNVGQSKPQ